MQTNDFVSQKNVAILRYKWRDKSGNEETKRACLAFELPEENADGAEKGGAVRSRKPRLEPNLARRWEEEMGGGDGERDG